MWLSLPTRVSNLAWVHLPDLPILLMPPSQALYLSFGRDISSCRVSSIRPNTVWTSSGLPAATRLGCKRIGLLRTGSSASSAWGWLVTCIASGTT